MSEPQRRNEAGTGGVVMIVHPDLAARAFQLMGCPWLAVLPSVRPLVGLESHGRSSGADGAHSATRGAS